MPVGAIARRLLCVLALALPANAADYHVATTGGGAACTSAAPCATLAAALALAGGGDQVLVHPGTYAEGIDSHGDAITGGTSEATRLVIRALANGTVTLRPASAGRVVNLNNALASWITLQGFDFDAVDLTGGDASDAFKIHCTGATCNVDGTDASSHIRVLDSTVRNSPSAQGVLVTGLASTHNEFIRLRVHNNGDTANLEHGIYVSTDDNVIEDCDLYANAANGLAVHGESPDTDANRNVARFNRSYGNGVAGPTGEGLEVSGQDHQVYGNAIWDNTTGDCISVFDSAVTTTDDTLVRDNRCFGLNAAGIGVDETATDTTLLRNLIGVTPCMVGPVTVARGLGRNGHLWCT